MILKICRLILNRGNYFSDYPSSFIKFTMEIAVKKNQQEKEQFEVTYGDQQLQVRRLYLANQVIFHISFPEAKPALVLTRATDHNKNRFWTSIPEGRQPEAAAIGPLIAAYILSNQ